MIFASTTSVHPIFVALLMFSLVIYFVPMIITINRNHPHIAPIIVINLFLGWCLVGWVVALAWAVTGEGASKKYKRPREEYNPFA